MNLLALAALLIVAAPATIPAAHAAIPSTGPAAAESPVKKGGDRIICRRFAENGTLIKKRKICLTNAQWGRLSEDAQRNTDTLQLKGIGGAEGCPPRASGC